MKHLIKAILNNGLLLSVLLMLMFPFAQAQDFELPTVNIPGVTNDGEAIPTFLAIGRFIFRAICMIMIGVSAVLLIKNLLRAWSKIRRDDDGRWLDVATEFFGGIMVCMVIIIFAAIGLAWVGG